LAPRRGRPAQGRRRRARDARTRTSQGNPQPANGFIFELRGVRRPLPITLGHLQHFFSGGTFWDILGHPGRRPRLPNIFENWVKVCQIVSRSGSNRSPGALPPSPSNAPRALPVQLCIFPMVRGVIKVGSGTKLTERSARDVRSSKHIGPIGPIRPIGPWC
jgi:hypothetical protein